MVNTARIDGASDIHNNEAIGTQTQVSIDAPTAVSLLSFEAAPAKTGIVLTWATAVEYDNFGFKLLRSPTNDLADAVEITFISGQGHGTNSGASYVYVDETAQPAQPYSYWLVDVDFSGLETVHGPVTITGLDTVGSRFWYYLPLWIK